MRQIITDEYGEIKLGDYLLPGIYQSMDISGSVRVDESEVMGKSGTSKQPLGFEDAVINVQFILPTDEKGTCYDRLNVFVGIFRKIDKNGKPYIYKIVNNLTNIWGIKDVLFKEIKVRDDNQKKDSLVLDLVFHEYLPVVVKQEKRAIPTNNLSPYTDFTKSEPATQSKNVTSPVKDDDKP